jgi:UDP-N-acetylglucosamine--dolichyl-phosphate N-acetylglucosaminephosphotransferase
MTYPVGALIAIMAILGNVEKYALILFIPYFIELILKARGKLVKESFANVNAEGMLENRYDKWYGLEHIIIDFLKKITEKATEKKVVLSLYCVQCLFAVISLVMFYLA